MSTSPRGNTLHSAREYSLSKHGKNFRLSPHFTLGEFACNDGSDKVLVHDALPPLLEKVRAHFGKPVSINSGYRSPAYNRKIGGAQNSRHRYGLAADIRVANNSVPPSEVHAFLQTLNPGGLGKYGTFTHVDVQGNNRRWTD